jgi:hypothetical protein
MASAPSRPHLAPVMSILFSSPCRDEWVLKRMDIGGARWGLDGVHAVITNGDFEEYWRFHLAREHQRLYPGTKQGQPVHIRRLTGYLTPEELHPKGSNAPELDCADLSPSETETLRSGDMRQEPPGRYGYCQL